ncbi:MAG TPA: asparagine synthase (glutamine-hydrolyzing) [Candidatus Hydrogenedentes bacterium]|nr:asparagine synthase (glutamine-hydrolyzing) [Candidatus Hydrogenedentota bacterium]
MCGICGIIHARRDDRADLEAVARMNDAMIHRGPDDAGVWRGGHAALAMRRLSILDVPGGHQPMTNEDGTVVVVFNGEIYNFQELRADLAARGHVFRTQSDTEVIVHAYEQFGDAALERFNGMFAFALYDAARDRLLAARDRLGIKPLFYGLNGETLAFASELGALRQSRLFSGDVNPAAIDAYFTFLYIPAPDTVYSGVHKLRPGEKLIFEKGRLTLERYWRPAFAPDPKWTLDNAAEAYRALLEDAVRLQRISDVPLGAFLSGGMDSSSVVAMLAGMSAQPVKTFTIGFDDKAADETPYARIAAKRFGTDHTEAVLHPDMAGIAPQLMAHFGEPFADSSAVPMWCVSRLARQQVTVALSGDGGDELFAGYTWMHNTRRVQAYRRVPPALRSLIDAALHLVPSSPATAKLRRFSRDAWLDDRAAFRRRETCLDGEARAALYRTGFANAVAQNAVDRFSEHAGAGPSDFDDWMLHQDTVMYLPDDILVKVDRMSMAHSIEARVPLLDHRLVEFAGTLPFELKYADGVSKRVAKHAFRGILPPELLARRKRGFAIPIHRWFREDLRRHFAEMVLTNNARCTTFLNQNAVRALFRRHDAGHEDNGHALWAILMFEHWLHL